MKHEFIAIFEREGSRHIALLPRDPGANGQGRTEEARKSSRMRSH